MEKTDQFGHIDLHQVQHSFNLNASPSAEERKLISFLAEAAHTRWYIREFSRLCVHEMGISLVIGNAKSLLDKHPPKRATKSLAKWDFELEKRRLLPTMEFELGKTRIDKQSPIDKLVGTLVDQILLHVNGPKTGQTDMTPCSTVNAIDGYLLFQILP